MGHLQRWAVLRALLAGTVVGFPACAREGLFLCETDDNCPEGVCQPSGYCSFPDTACASGQRYGTYAHGALADACVEVPSGSSGETGATSAVDTTPLSDGTTDASSSGAGTTGEAVSTRGDTGTTGAATTGEASGDTGAEGFDCEVVDDFEDDALHPQWSTWGPAIVRESGGMLHFDIAVDFDPSGAGIYSPHSAEAGAAMVEISTSPTWGIEQYFGILDVVPNNWLMIIATNEELICRMKIDGQQVDACQVPHDLVAHRYVRIVDLGGDVAWEASPDALQWDLLTRWTPPVPFDFSAIYLEVGAGNWDVAPDPPLLSFGEVRLCR